MASFTVREFGDNDGMMITRREERIKKVSGLPATTSTTLILKNNEIDELIEVLKQYANQGRN